VSIRCPEESESSLENKRSKLSKARGAAKADNTREDLVTARALASPPREQKKVVPAVSQAKPPSTTKLDDPEPTQEQSVNQKPGEVAAVPVVAFSPFQTLAKSSQIDTTNTSALDEQPSSRTLFKKPSSDVTQSAQSSRASIPKQVGFVRLSINLVSFSGR
jgi:hypothetical protein